MGVRTLAVVLLLATSVGAFAETPDSTPPQTPITLKDLLGAALSHDGRILAAFAELDTYRARYAEVSAVWFPVFKLEALFGGPVGERLLDPSCSGNSECLRVTRSSETGDTNFGALGYAVGGKLEGVLPLYTFGKITEAKNAANAGIKASEAGIRRAKQEVAMEVRRAYYGWNLAQSAIEILEDGKSKLKETETKLQKMLDEMNEEVSDRDLFKLRYYASGVDNLLVQAKQGREISLAALRFLTDLSDLGISRPLELMEFEELEFPIEARDAYVSMAIQNRPELRMIQSAEEAALAAVRIQEASFYPDFFLTGYFKGSYSPVQDFIKNPLLNQGLTNYDGVVALGFQVTLDIPQKMARLSKARAEHLRLQHQVRQAREAVGLDIDKRISDVQSALLNLKIFKTGKKAAKAWMNANLMDYGVGIFNTKDLLDSVAAHAKSQMDLDKAGYDLRLSMDALKASAGEELGHAP
jgi:outer membrane protein